MKKYMRQIAIVAAGLVPISNSFINSRSKSDTFREIYNAYKFKKALTKVQQVGCEQFLTLGIESIDQAEEYLG